MRYTGMRVVIMVFTFVSAFISVQAQRSDTFHVGGAAAAIRESNIKGAKQKYSYSGPDVISHFPGGFDSMVIFIKANIRVPGTFTKKGKVFITLTVNADGSLSNVRVSRSLQADCDAEALRVVNLMPRWIPARYEGEFVVSQRSFTIAFNEPQAGEE